MFLYVPYKGKLINLSQSGKEKIFRNMDATLPAPPHGAVFLSMFWRGSTPPQGPVFDSLYPA
jgi:hypothetical protein